MGTHSDRVLLSAPDSDFSPSSKTYPLWCPDRPIVLIFKKMSSSDLSTSPETTRDDGNHAMKGVNRSSCVSAFLTGQNCNGPTPRSLMISPDVVQEGTSPNNQGGKNRDENENKISSTNLQRNNLSSTDIGSLALGSVSLGDDDDDLTAAIKSASFVMLPNLEFSEVEAALQDLTPSGNDLPTTPTTREETGQNESSWQSDEPSFLSVGSPDASEVHVSTPFPDSRQKSMFKSPFKYARPSCDSGGLMLPPPSPSPLKTVYAGAARPIPPLLFNDSASSSSSFTVPPTPFNSLNEGSGLESEPVMHAIVVSSEEVVGVEEEPTVAQADSDAALMAELNQICAIQEKLYEEEFGEKEGGGQGTESVVMEKAQGGAKKKRGGGGFRAARKDVCKNMSTEEFERFTQEKKISDWVEPKSIYDKETRRREKTATRLSMLRQLVPGVTSETDNTTLYEETARYLVFLREKLDNKKELDKQFLKQHMPW